MPREASSTTVVSKPASRASIAEKNTQKSVARPHRVTRVEAALAQIAGKPGRRLAVVLAKRRIGIDRRGDSPCGSPARHAARRARDGTPRPMCPARNGPATRSAGRNRPRSSRRAASAGMGAGEGHMPRRVPILRDDDMRETARQAIDRRHDRVAVRHRERAAGAEIALRIGDDQHIAFARRAFHRIRLPHRRLTANSAAGRATASPAHRRGRAAAPSRRRSACRRSGRTAAGRPSV